MHITIRPALEKDIPAIYELICQLEETIFEYAVFRQVYKENLHGPCCIYLVAESSTCGVLGFVGVHIQSLLHHCGKVAEIQELVVNKKCRHSGIGKQLLQAAEQQAMAKNCVSLEVTANSKRRAAHRFYKGNGLVCTHKKFVKNLKPELAGADAKYLQKDT